MTRRKHKQTAEELVVELIEGNEPETAVEPVEPDAEVELEIDAEVAADNIKRNSVVRPAYKKRYAERAAANGGGKVAQRSCWDWLAQTLAGECLVGSKISIDRFLALLDANGVDHSRWNNRNKGWEGRLRMTGRLALQKVVAAQGVLKTADGETLEAPADWVAKHTH
jgi:hypothetical protein